MSKDMRQASGRQSGGEELVTELDLDTEVSTLQVTQLHLCCSPAQVPVFHPSPDPVLPIFPLIQNSIAKVSRTFPRLFACAACCAAAVLLGPWARFRISRSPLLCLSVSGRHKS
jgi:hypothetical protein